MGLLYNEVKDSPVKARVVPFFIFIALTALQGQFGPGSQFWVYVAKTLVGAWMLWEIWKLIPEVRWAWSLEAVLVGVLVCVMWVGIDGFYPKMGKTEITWDPHKQFGPGSALAWFYCWARILGSSLVVPPLEEMFYRSFLYRWLVKVDFLKMPMNQVHWLSLIVTSTIFGLVHHQWLAGILCGLAYQWLVLRKNRLGDAMTAHAITNFLLGLWVVFKGDWKFW